MIPLKVKTQGWNLQEYLVVINRATWHTFIWSQAKLKLPFLQSFLTTFFNQKECYWNEDLSLTNLVHFCTILDIFMRFPYAFIHQQASFRIFTKLFILSNLSPYFESPYDLNKQRGWGCISKHGMKPCNPVSSQGNLDKSRLVQHPVVPDG